MGGSGFLWIWRCVILIQLFSGVLGWGKEGHYATCKIAEAFLTEDAKAAINRLLPDYAGGDLASLCSWPDQVRFHLHWSSALHYVDTPDFKCNYEYCRDCHDLYAHKDRCVTGAIYNYTRQLEAANDSYMIVNYNLTEALLFLSHFVGDVHQPLHVGFTGDQGGNTIIVRWYRRKTNLHHVWDDMIIDSALKAFYQSNLSKMIQAIQSNITEGVSNSMPLWEDCASDQTACANPYASESIKLACKYAYRHATPGSTLTDEYFLSRLPIVEQRLAQGGVRLAAILNHVFASGKKIAR